MLLRRRLGGEFCKWTRDEYTHNDGHYTWLSEMCDFHCFGLWFCFILAFLVATGKRNGEEDQAHGGQHGGEHQHRPVLQLQAAQPHDGQQGKAHDHPLSKAQAAEDSPALSRQRAVVHGPAQLGARWLDIGDINLRQRLHVHTAHRVDGAGGSAGRGAGHVGGATGIGDVAARADQLR